MSNIKEKLFLFIIIVIFWILCVKLPERVEKLKSYMLLRHYFVEKNIIK